MKILILGSTGILGGTLNFFLKKKKNIEIFCISRNKKNKLDIYLDDFTNITKLKKLISNINPTHIINCIGITKFNNSYKSNFILLQPKKRGWHWLCLYFYSWII